jgi:hypothetical protein
MLESKLEGFTGKLVRGAVALYCSAALYGCVPGTIYPVNTDETLNMCCSFLECRRKGYDFCYQKDKKKLGNRTVIECICGEHPFDLNDGHMFKSETYRVRPDMK